MTGQNINRQHDPISHFAEGSRVVFCVVRQQSDIIVLVVSDAYFICRFFCLFVLMLLFLSPIFGQSKCYSAPFVQEVVTISAECGCTPFNFSAGTEREPFHCLLAVILQFVSFAFAGICAVSSCSPSHPSYHLVLQLGAYLHLTPSLLFLCFHYLAPIL
jgi:hypothetical protein